MGGRKKSAINQAQPGKKPGPIGIFGLFCLILLSKMWNHPIRVKDIFYVFFAGLMTWGIYLIAEELTITTYYPSPYGVYSQLRTRCDTFLATESGTSSDPACQVVIGRNSAISSVKMEIAGNIRAGQTSGGTDSPLLIGTDASGNVSIESLSNSPLFIASQNGGLFVVGDNSGMATPNTRKVEIGTLTKKVDLVVHGSICADNLSSGCPPSPPPPPPQCMNTANLQKCGTVNDPWAMNDCPAQPSSSWLPASCPAGYRVTNLHKSCRDTSFNNRMDNGQSCGQLPVLTTTYKCCRS